MWTVSFPKATLSAAFGSGALEIDRAGEGLQVSLRGTLPQFTIFRINRRDTENAPSAPGSLLDWHIRGADLVATFEPDSGNVQRSFYWREIDPAAKLPVSGVECIASSQTPLLDSQPEFLASFDLPTLESFFLGRQNGASRIFSDCEWTSPRTLSERIDCVVVRIDREYSVLVAIEPSDYCGLELASKGSGLSFSFRLFVDRLEKGVIRRGRMAALVLPRRYDFEMAHRAMKRFLESPIPLTT